MAAKKPLKTKVKKKVKLNPKGILGSVVKRRKSQDAMMRELLKK